MWQLEKSPALSNTFSNVTDPGPTTRPTPAGGTRCRWPSHKVPKLHQRPVAPAGRLANPTWVDRPGLRPRPPPALGEPRRQAPPNASSTTSSPRSPPALRPGTPVVGLHRHRGSRGRTGPPWCSGCTTPSPTARAASGCRWRSSTSNDPPSPADGHGPRPTARQSTRTPLDGRIRATSPGGRRRGAGRTGRRREGHHRIGAPAGGRSSTRSAQQGRSCSTPAMQPRWPVGRPPGQVLSRCSPLWTRAFAGPLVRYDHARAGRGEGRSAPSGRQRQRLLRHRRGRRLQVPTTETSGAEVDELRMSMPVSIRGDWPRRTQRGDPMAGGNAFSPTQVMVPTGEMRAGEAVRRGPRTPRPPPASERALGALGGAAAVINLLPTAALLATGERATAGIDFVCSNVRAAPFDLYIGGALMEANYPVGPLAGTAFNLTTMSYRGTPVPRPARGFGRRSMSPSYC